MATQTIVIDNPEDYREGDLFSGTYKNSEGIFTIVRDRPLVRSTFVGRLFVERCGHLSYVNCQSDQPEEGNWHQVRVTREVPIPSKHIKFAPGSLVEHKHGARYMATTSGGWVGMGGMRFSPGDSDIRETIENREVFENNYTLIDGSYEDADD